MPNRLDPNRHARWREYIRRQAESGLSIAEFCARQGLRRTTFHSWKSRLRLADLKNLTPALPCRQPTFLPVTVSAVEQALSPVTVSAVEQALREPLPIVAELPSGVRLRIPTANAELACRLVRVIMLAQSINDSGDPQ